MPSIPFVSLSEKTVSMQFNKVSATLLVLLIVAAGAAAYGFLVPATTPPQTVTTTRTTTLTATVGPGAPVTTTVTRTATITSTQLATVTATATVIAPVPTVVDLAKKEGKVSFMHIYGSPNYVAVFAAWNKKYPEIKLEELHIQPDDSVVRIKSEYAAGKQTWDVYSSGIAQSAPLIGAGYMMQYYPKEAEALDKKFRDPQGFWTVDVFNMNGPAYNSKKVKPEELDKTDPDSISKNPMWKGRLGIRELASGGAKNNLMGWFQSWGEEKTIQFIRDLFVNQKPLMHPDDGYLNEALAKGEVDLVVAGLVHSNIQRMKTEGASVDWLLTAKSVPSTLSPFYLAILNGAPHPNAAKLFVEFLLSAEGMKAAAPNLIVPRAGSGGVGAVFEKVLQYYVVLDANIYLSNIDKMVARWQALKTELKL